MGSGDPEKGWNGERWWTKGVKTRVHRTLYTSRLIKVRRINFLLVILTSYPFLCKKGSLICILAVVCVSLDVTVALVAQL